MPRRKQEAVIPTTSLVASAVRYPGKAARIFRPTSEWQREAYRHYEICGEARYAAQYFGHSLSRVVLGMGKKSGTTIAPQTEGAAVALLAGLFNGKAGQAQMMSALGVHLTIAGECYLVGRQVVGPLEDTADHWEIVSVLEMDVKGVGDNATWTINYGNGMIPVELTENDVVIRIWQPHPARRIEADSAFRSLLPILTEIEWLTMHIFAQVRSRLAGAGLLFLSQGVEFPPAVGQQGEPVANEASNFMLMLAEAMMKPIEDPSDPRAVVPPVVMVPPEVMESGNVAQLLQFWSALDENSKDLRDEAIRRFALGMDLPPEQVLGMSSNSGTGGGSSNGVSHWGAWQVDEATIKLHIEPMVELIANSLTIGFIRPLTEDLTDVVTYDTSALRLRPDRSKESIELYNLGAIKMQVMLRENGFDPETDMMDDGERHDWLLRKVASGSATPEQVNAALAALGVNLGVTSDNTTPRETRPDPSLEDHPTRPRTPDNALYAAADALVYRALERAGNRIKGKGVQPPGVASYNMHTVHQVNGTADAVLEDAWACAPQVLDGIGLTSTVPVIDSLNAYCKSLFISQEPHTRERLERWLSATVPA